MSEDRDWPIAEVCREFQNLYPRQVGFSEFRVLSLRDGEPTGYEVDIKEFTCDCDDMRYNREGAEVCDHLAVALHVRDPLVEADEHALRRATQEVQYMREASDDLRQTATAWEAEATVQDVETDDGAGGETAETPVDDRDPLELHQVEDWLHTGYAADNLVEVREGSHGTEDGIILEPDSGAMAEHEKESFKGLIKSLEDSNCHAGFLDDGCGQCGESDDEYFWFVPETDRSEVWS